MKICYQKITLPDPIGFAYIVADTNNLRAIVFRNNWEKTKQRLGDMACEQNTIIEQTQMQLLEYFAKKRTQFDLPIAFSGTEFQQKTWQALLTIPYGETCSYSEQAALIENSKAVRAVGGANSRNPIAIVVPCHRVIGKSGKLTGYAGGLASKKFLLTLEKSHTTTSC
ncbi:MAG: methylated-DNA--[protein]-cysteine S-methyltransferase [Desulfocapsa sp.]|nr:methylated-DNA--[protein]-cysteine S-methyltransferase [Desulfocapsa sp.]